MIPTLLFAIKLCISAMICALCGVAILLVAMVKESRWATNLGQVILGISIIVAIMSFLWAVWL